MTAIDGTGFAKCEPAEMSELPAGVALAGKAHADLLDPALPLLAQSWQLDRLLLGDHGSFQPGGRAADKDSIAINLVKGSPHALIRHGEGRISLSYDPQNCNVARSALLAGAAMGGWPIAADTQSLALLTLAERIAASEIPVLLEGPTGTGKEVFAKFVHRMSNRAAGPFIAVNCAAMPEAMLEGLLFGHRKGAFTGAAEAREGLFRAADKGTLLLDEIGEMPIALQAKLLRTLQEKEVLPLGATKPVPVDVRIVAATNRTLAAEVEQGRFREDLLYRLNVFPMQLPALRSRPRDIAPLAFGMLLRHACEPGKPSWICEDALRLLEGHAWPGNVRELENVIRRAILLAGKDHQIELQHVVFDRAARPVDASVPMGGGASLANGVGRSRLSDVSFQSEAQAILRRLDQFNGHRGKTARSLGISERTLRYRLASMRESGLIAAGGGS